MFEQVHTEALGGFDRIIGLDLDDVAVDGSLHQAPTTGRAPAPPPPTATPTGEPATAHAVLCLGTTTLIVGRLIDWRNRWNST